MTFLQKCHFWSLLTLIFWRSQKHQKNVIDDPMWRFSDVFEASCIEGFLVVHPECYPPVWLHQLWAPPTLRKSSSLGFLTFGDKICHSYYSLVPPFIFSKPARLLPIGTKRQKKYPLSDSGSDLLAWSSAGISDLLVLAELFKADAHLANSRNACRGVNTADAIG
jgi:hypothetical protein